MARKRKRIVNNGFLDVVKNVGASQRLSGYGTQAAAANYDLLSLQYVVLSYMYTGNGTFTTGVDIPVTDALAKGIKVESDELDAKDIIELERSIDNCKLLQAVASCLKWSRLYGGSAIVINTGSKPYRPLSLKEGMPFEFKVYDKWEIVSDTGYIDNQEFYYINGVKIHKSRVFLFKGKEAPSYIKRSLGGWGLSEGECMVRALNTFTKTKNVLFEILDESKVDIYKIAGLAQAMNSPSGVQKVSDRIQAANQLKSYVQALVLDASEEYDSKTQSFSGLSEIMKENRIDIASMWRIPMTKLFGMSSAGFNTGESDIENYNQMVAAEVQEPSRQFIQELVKFVAFVKFGYTPSLYVTFPKMKEVPKKEEKEIHSIVITYLLQLYDRGLLSAEDLESELKKDGSLSGTTKFDYSPLPRAGGIDEVD